MTFNTGSTKSSINANLIVNVTINEVCDGSVGLNSP